MAGEWWDSSAFDDGSCAAGVAADGVVVGRGGMFSMGL